MCFDLEKIRKIMLEPSKFFKAVRKEKTLDNALKYFVVLSLISTVLGVFAGYLFQEQLYQFTESLFGLKVPRHAFAIQVLFLSITIGYIWSIVGSFIVAGILHVWLLIFGAKGKYTKTYQLSVYSGTPGYLLGWIPFVNFFVWIYSLALLIIGTQKMYGFSKRRSIAIYLIPLAIFLLIMLMMITFLISIKSNPLLINSILNNSAV